MAARVVEKIFSRVIHLAIDDGAHTGPDGQPDIRGKVGGTGSDRKASDICSHHASCEKFTVLD
jgi:hypothetical protein